jgi:hypothetical protein
MGLFDKLKGRDKDCFGLVDYGSQKKTGGHDHRNNRGDDRTTAQKEGDRSRRKRKR